MTKHPELRFMQAAIDLSAEAVRDDAGGPFGAVVVRDAEVVGRGRNRVLVDKDPSAHAEILAIREACRNLGDHRLAGCVVYTSSEVQCAWPRSAGLESSTSTSRTSGRTRPRSASTTSGSIGSWDWHTRRARWRCRS